MNEQQETPLFFEHENARLFGVLHEPAKRGPEARGRGVLFCPAFAEEAAISQRVCVEFARVLAARGYHVLRFDYRGCGESEGDFDSVTPATHLADVCAALAWLRKAAGTARVSLFGLRFGASLAAMAAATDHDVEALLLWEPVARPGDHFKNFLRMQATADNALAGRVVETRENLLAQLEDGRTIDVLGYPTTPDCFRSFMATDLLGNVGNTRAPTLVVAIGRQKRSRKDLQAVVDAYEQRDRPVDFQQIAEQPFWIDRNDPWRELASWQGHDELFRSSADWLDRLTAHR